jgi:hypothetical protein
MALLTAAPKRAIVTDPQQSGSERAKDADHP